VRREVLDHVLVLDEGHLDCLLRQYQLYFNESRPHQGLDSACRRSPPWTSTSSKSFREVKSALGGLHVDYRGAA
jgi:hypothetical protein